MLIESVEKSCLIDDDLTKKKRIEAISKHLKFDLLESFKSPVQFSNDLSLSRSLSSNSYYVCSPTASQLPYQGANNESFDQDLNNSLNSSCLSPISSYSTKGIKNTISRVDENFTPNLTIGSSYSSGMS